MAQERKGRALNMYPPGRIIFLRPIKIAKRKKGEDGEAIRKIIKRWDAVWVSPREVVGEGILVSKRVGLHNSYSITATITGSNSSFLCISHTHVCCELQPAVLAWPICFQKGTKHERAGITGKHAHMWKCRAYTNVDW